jgi:hypothetical protein
MTKRSWIILAALVLVSGAVLFYGTRGDAQEPVSIVKEEPKPAVPDKVVYGIFFRQSAAFKAKADDIAKDGGDGRSLRTHFARIASLDDAQSELVDRVVADYISEAGLIDAQQKAVSDAARGKNPDGYVPNGADRERPASYREFTLEREQLYLRMRDQLESILGAETFARLDKALRDKIAGNPQSILGAISPSAADANQQDKP